MDGFETDPETGLRVVRPGTHRVRFEPEDGGGSPVGPGDPPGDDGPDDPDTDDRQPRHPTAGAGGAVAQGPRDREGGSPSRQRG